MNDQAAPRPLACQLDLPNELAGRIMRVASQLDVNPHDWCLGVLETAVVRFEDDEAEAVANEDGWMVGGDGRHLVTICACPSCERWRENTGTPREKPLFLRGNET